MNKYLYCALSLAVAVTPFARAFELSPIPKSVMMPKIQSAINAVCDQLKESQADEDTVPNRCEVAIYKVTSLDAATFTESSVSALAQKAFDQNSTQLTELKLLGENSAHLLEVQDYIRSMGQFANLSEGDHPFIDELNLQIYKMATKGRIYFEGGKSDRCMGTDHPVFAVLRLSKDQEEGELITWSVGK